MSPSSEHLLDVCKRIDVIHVRLRQISVKAKQYSVCDVAYVLTFSQRYIYRLTMTQRLDRSKITAAA